MKINKYWLDEEVIPEDIDLEDIEKIVGEETES